MAKRTAATKRKKMDDNEKKAICVRMGGELYERVKGDADEGERTPPAQVRLILKEHYGLDKIPQNVLTTIRQDSQHIFKKRAGETLSGKLPTLEALMEMERRGAREGGIVWYDETDDLGAQPDDPVRLIRKQINR